MAEISGTTVWRWLSEDAIRPWRHRSWIFPRDPDFETKAAHVLDLYAREWEGRPLGKRDYVISADEKTSIQARIRRHPTLAPAAGRLAHVEHEYDRGGALAYLAAWDVHRAKVFGRCEETTGIEPFGRLVCQVMTTEPYASAQARLLGGRQRQQSPRRARSGASFGPLPQRTPRPAAGARIVAQPGIYFSVVHRKVLTPNDFANLAEGADRLAAFEGRYEETAALFEWRFTREDLALLLKKLADKPDYRVAA